jgi:hypothetical protein
MLTPLAVASREDIVTHSANKNRRSSLSMTRDRLIRSLSAGTGEKLADNGLSGRWKVPDLKGEVLNEASNHSHRSAH